MVFPIQISVYASDLGLEHKLKAIFLGRLPSFVSWPTEISKNEKSQSFDLCILGYNPYDSLLDSMYINKKIKGKVVLIHYFNNISDISNCHLLFISESERNKITQILAFTRNKAILTVGETRGFAEKNGLIQFYMNAQKLRIKINYQAAIKQGFKISAPLLSIANVINR